MEWAHREAENCPNCQVLRVMVNASLVSVWHGGYRQGISGTAAA